MNECAYDPVATVVQEARLGDAAFERRFIEYLRSRAANAKVFRDQAAKRWDFGAAQEHVVVADVCDDLADFLESGDARRELK